MMCESVVRGDPEDQSAAKNKDAERLFKKYFLKNFVELQSDRIVNVRLQLSETLALLYEKNERLERMSEEEKIVGENPENSYRFLSILDFAIYRFIKYRVSDIVTRHLGEGSPTPTGQCNSLFI